MHFVYQPQNVCSRVIEMEINNGVITDVKFTGGCNGNLKTIPRLVDGMTADEIASKISGVTCGNNNTSCGDQLARAVLAAKEAEIKFLSK